jgi:hypothetical protein
MKESAATAIALGSPEAIRAALTLEAGNDPARVEALRVQMVGASAMLKRIGYWLLGLGLLASLTLFGAIIGLPMAGMGTGMAWFFGKRVRNINTACEQYLASIKVGV